ncbi:MAG TPA: O-antigen ligase family protein [Ktedonobacteraceae bacterium]|nr:O-antigen ligase family protein [Ktedonobacteraceae bacterium]
MRNTPTLPETRPTRQTPAIHRNNRALIAPPARRSNDTVLTVLILITVLGLTPILVFVGTTFSFGLLLGCLVALAVALIVARWPVAGFYIIGICVTLVEQSALTYPIFTDRLNVFYWPPSLEGLIERPIGFLMLLILVVTILQRLARREKILSGGSLFWPFLLFLLSVAWGVFHGLSSGGNVKIIVVEVRPFWYLFMSYIIACNLVTKKKHVRNFFWIVIVDAGIKGLQGTYIYLFVLHGKIEGLNESMSHEESFFFVALILLIILFSLHSCYRPQLYAALATLPFLLISLVANNRRADYVALLVGAMVAWALIFMVKPRARKGLVIGMIIFLVVGGAYVIAFAHSTGGLGGPARAILSIVNPSSADARDASSNLYRIIEDYDLKYTVKQNPLGMGFGRPFLEPIPLPDISGLDQYYNYVPHNTVYWVWMRLGPLGYFALWLLIGSIIVRGSQIARKLRDRYLQLVAIYIVAVTFMEVVVAYADYQFFFYRNVIYLGLLVGILVKLSTLDKGKEQTVHEASHGVPQFAVPGVGSQRP